MRDDRARGRRAGAGVLRFLVPAELAGKLIGRRGARIHEVQVRSGARVQLFDREEEKLVEVTGARASIDEAAAVLLDDLARLQRPALAGQLCVAALVPEALADWVSGAGGAPPALALEGLAAGPPAPWGPPGSERRVVLRGGAGPLGQALRRLSLQLGRHARWASTGLSDLPPELRELREAGDPADDFYSTENLCLGLREGTASVLSGDGEHGGLLAQIQEDSGSAVRIQPGSEKRPRAWIEIAGSFRAKLTALLEVASLLLLLTGAAGESDDAGGVLELFLPATGPSSLTCEEILQIPALASAGASADIQGERTVVTMQGRRVKCCEAAVALSRAAERRAAEHERSYGPPPLLIDYLARWFGRDMRQWPSSALASRVANQNKRQYVDLPAMQIAGEGSVLENGPGALKDLSAGATGAEGDGGAQSIGTPATPQCNDARPPAEAERSGPVSAKRRRRRLRLFNPFGKDESRAPSRAPDETPPLPPPGVAGGAPSATAEGGAAPGRLVGYSEGESDSEDGRAAREGLSRAQDPSGGESEGGEAPAPGAAGPPAAPPGGGGGRESDEDAALAEEAEAGEAGASDESPHDVEPPGGSAADPSLPGRSRAEPSSRRLPGPAGEASWPQHAEVEPERFDPPSLQPRPVQPVDASGSTSDPLWERKQAILQRLELL